MPRAHLAGESLGVLPFRIREGFAEGSHRHGPRAELVLRNAEEKRAVDAARVGDERGSHLSEDGPEALQLLGVAHAGVPSGGAPWRRLSSTPAETPMRSDSNEKNAITGQISPEPKPYVWRPRPKRKLTP